MASNHLMVIIAPKDYKSKKFFNEETLKKLQEFLKERAPKEPLISQLHKFYPFEPINMTKLKENFDIDDQPLEPLYGDITISRGYDGAFEFVQFDVADVEKITEKYGARKLSILPGIQIREFFANAQVNIDIFTVEALDYAKYPR